MQNLLVFKMKETWNCNQKKRLEIAVEIATAAAT